MGVKVEDRARGYVGVALRMPYIDQALSFVVGAGGLALGDQGELAPRGGAARGAWGGSTRGGQGRARSLLLHHSRDRVRDPSLRQAPSL